MKKIKIKYKIGVMGEAGRSKILREKLVKAAKVVGEEIAKQNGVLVTGACMGVPDIATKAASGKGGLVLGFSPAKSLREHIESPFSYPYPSQNVELIFTNLDKIGRNVLSIIECDGIICIGGGIGTLNEFSIAAHEGKVIGVLEGFGSLIERILPEIEGQISEKSGAVLIKDRNPKRLVKKVIQEIEKRKEKIRKEIPLVFENKRGEQLIGILHLPKKEKPPLVVLVHGFGQTKSKRSLVRLARLLEKEGVAVFRFDFSGCGDSEGELENTTLKRQIEDLDAIIKGIFKQVNLDSRRMAFVAESLGCVVSTLYYKNHSDISLKTMVFWTPAFCQKKLIPIWNSEEQLKEWKKKGYLIVKDKKMGLEYLKENENKDYSSLLSKIHLPILILHGKKDEVVPLKFSEKLAEKYKNIRLVKLNTDHKFEDYFEQQRLIKETINWIKKYF